MPDTDLPARTVVVRCLFCNTANRVDLGRLDAGPKCGKCERPIRLDRPYKVTDADFDQTVASAGVPILLDCYADWCGPCRMMAPTLDEFARERAGEVLVLKLDTDANSTTAGRLGIRGIPTLVAFRGGMERGRHVGLADRGVMERLVG